MDVILLERVAKLGQMGEVVKVKDGYARNFLLPQGKALRVNAANAIKELGIHAVSIVLHPEVTAEIRLNIARSKDEAELQAAGKSIQELAAEEEAAAEFEIQELFDDLGAAGMDDYGDEAPAPKDDDA